MPKFLEKGAISLLLLTATAPGIAQSNSLGDAADVAFGQSVRNKIVLPRGWLLYFDGVSDGVARFKAQFNEHAHGCCAPGARHVDVVGRVQRLVCTTPELAGYLSAGRQYRVIVITDSMKVGPIVRRCASPERG